MLHKARSQYHVNILFVLFSSHLSRRPRSYLQYFELLNDCVVGSYLRDKRLVILTYLAISLTYGLISSGSYALAKAQET